MSDAGCASIRGAGGKAFVAGTDFSRFLTFSSGDVGVSWEQEMGTGPPNLFALPVPTSAVIERCSVGGGVNNAAACNLRIATLGSHVDAPTAKRLANRLAMPNYSSLLGGFGESRTKRKLSLGDLLNAEEAVFLARLIPAEVLEETLQDGVNFAARQRAFDDRDQQGGIQTPASAPSLAGRVRP